MLQRKEESLVQRLLVEPQNTLNTLSRSGKNRIQVGEDEIVQSAYSRFQEKYPKWAASCFDIYFLEHAGKEAVALKDADALSKAYLTQIPSANTSNNPENIAQVRTVAEDFLNILAAERIA